jgi:hypothetical protein
MNKLFTWDEIDNELRERQCEEAWITSWEGGWRTEGWTEDGKVAILRTDRHTALETWAASEEEAHANFLKVSIYLEYNETEA